MSGTLLRVEGLRTVFDTAGGDVRAVDGVDFSIARGETFALVGESGCGKSMTALTVLRLLPENGRIAAGAVRLSGDDGDTDLLALPEAAMRGVRGRRIAMIFQEPATSLNPVLTVGRQIEEVLERHGALDERARHARVIELLESVGVPDAARRAGEFPFQLSGGLKQRAMIAIALAGGPDLLIADEPTTALDVTIQAQVLEVLRGMQARTGMSLLLITHDLGIVAAMAHRVAVMYAGQIVETAARDEFFSAPRHPYTRKLFESLPGAGKRGGALATIAGQVPALNQVFRGCRFADRCDRVFARCRDEVPVWTSLAPGQGVRCHLADEVGAQGTDTQVRRGPAATGMAVSASPAADPTAAPLLEVRDLRVWFPIRRGLFKRTVAHVRAVDGVSLSVGAGRTLALVGESGCGKTTVGRGLLQLVRPDAGEVLFTGTDLTRLSGEDLRTRRRDFQIIFQDPYASLNPRMRVTDILLEGMTALGIGGGAAERSRRVDELLQQVGLSPEARDRYPHEFSGGQRQRVAIARALAVNPKLIVCDEPTSALDVSVQAQILNLLRRLQRELGLSYLFITHNIAVVEYLADEVAVMYLGRIVEHGPAELVLKHARHPYTQALLAAVPRVDDEAGRTVIRLEGEQPSPVNPPSGCHFHPRCPRAIDACRGRYPPAVSLGGGHAARCLLLETRGSSE